MTYRFGLRSRKNLQGVHSDLVRVMEAAIARSPVDFAIVEGVRSLALQQHYVKIGASRTMNSRHLTGHAVDIVPLVGSIAKYALCRQVADVVLAVAKELAIRVDWGGTLWGKSFVDEPHFQLSWTHYPAPKMVMEND